MADLAARREARRRKILENAGNRFNRITGLNHPGGNSVDDSNLNSNLRPYESFAPSAANFITEDDLCSQPTTIFEDLTNPVPFDKPCDRPDPLVKEHVRKDSLQNEPNLQYHPYIILLLGLAIRYLNLILANVQYYIGIDLTYMHVEKIFVPFLIYEITYLLVWKPKVELSAALQMLLLLQQVRAKWVTRILITFSYTVLVFKDLLLYFFAFIFVDMLFSFFAKDDIF